MFRSACYNCAGEAGIECPVDSATGEPAGNCREQNYALEIDNVRRAYSGQLGAKTVPADVATAVGKGNARVLLESISCANPDSVFHRDANYRGGVTNNALFQTGEVAMKPAGYGSDGGGDGQTAQEMQLPAWITPAKAKSKLEAAFSSGGPGSVSQGSKAASPAKVSLSEAQEKELEVCFCCLGVFLGLLV